MFGLIGERLDYSLSQKIHEAIRPMKYNLIPLNKEEFHQFMKDKNFQGINVTIPYKEAVMPYLDDINEEAKQIGAVNTVINQKGRLYGYNTDVYGFKYLVDSLNLDLKGKNVLILGTGGSSKTAAYVLKSYGVKTIEKASRNPQNQNISYLESEQNTYSLIVNTTPVGTFPKEEQSPIDISKYHGVEGIIDLVYNPRVTKLQKQAKALNIKYIGGIDMLYVQAVYANELFANLMETKMQNYQSIYPSKVQGCPKIPSSKSLAHRSIICAALGTKESLITNLDLSEDINQTIKAVEALGAKCDYNENNLELKVMPINYQQLPKEITVDCKESGTTLRLIIPIVSALGIIGNYKGDKKLFERPLDSYEEIFSNAKLEFRLTQNDLTVGAGLKSAKFSLQNLKSSQFASGLLLALPLMGGGSVEILDNMQSSSYFSLTISTMKTFGIEVTSSRNTINVKNTYKSQNYNIEIDYSQLAFFSVLAAINSSLSFKDVNYNSMQGDKIILDILENMGANLEYSENILTISPDELNAINIDCADCPDLVPILIVLAVFAKGKTTLENTNRLKYKESPRDEAMEEELGKLGIKIEIKENSIIINGPKHPQKSAKLNSHNDHRIAMALSVLAISGKYNIEIENSTAVNKSFPDFYKTLKSIQKI